MAIALERYLTDRPFMYNLIVFFWGGGLRRVIRSVTNVL